MAEAWSDLPSKARAIEGRAAEIERQAADLRRAMEMLLVGDGAHAKLLADANARAAEAEERTQAVRIVLMALVHSIAPRAIKRRKFQDAVRDIAATVPSSGPLAVRHEVFLEETRRVLGVKM